MTDQPWAPQTLAYGGADDQFGQLRAPKPGGARVPVAVLLHGGFWLDQWTLTLMDPIADDLASRGIATWNIEYRRADKHGWTTMSSDVEAAVRYLGTLAVQHPLDLDRLVLIGHSAGGQLAARVCADLLAAGAAVTPLVVVSLAGVVDLVDAVARDLGEGAVAYAVGGTPADIPERYAASSPMARLPLRAALVVVNSDQDDGDLNDMQRKFAGAAQVAGDQVALLEGAGDHFTLIDPRSRLWDDTMAQTAKVLERAAVAQHIKRLYAALGDRERFDSHLDPQITIWESDADRMLIGLDELDRLRDERASRSIEDVQSLSVTPEKLHVEVWDDTSMARYLLIARRPGSSTTDQRFRVTDVLRRRDGRWRIVHHHAESEGGAQGSDIRQTDASQDEFLFGPEVSEHL